MNEIAHIDGDTRTYSLAVTETAPVGWADMAIEVEILAPCARVVIPGSAGAAVVHFDLSPTVALPRGVFAVAAWGVDSGGVRRLVTTGKLKIEGVC